MRKHGMPVPIGPAPSLKTMCTSLSEEKRGVNVAKRQDSVEALPSKYSSMLY